MKSKCIYLGDSSKAIDGRHCRRTLDAKRTNEFPLHRGSLSLCIIKEVVIKYLLAVPLTGPAKHQEEYSVLRLLVNLSTA